MIISMPSLLDHLDQMIFITKLEGHAIASITLPVWCQQVFVNECMATTSIVTQAKAMEDLDAWGICEYRGTQILFHDKLFSEIRTHWQ